MIICVCHNINETALQLLAQSGNTCPVGKSCGKCTEQIKKIYKEVALWKKKIAVDFLGQELEVGQRVVFMPPHIKELKWGYIKKINPKMVRIMYGRNNASECSRLQTEIILLSQEQAIMLAQQRLLGNT